MVGSKAPEGTSSEEFLNNGDVSDDDVVDVRDYPTWFWMGMTREEKIEARRSWRSSLIIKLLGIKSVITTYGNASRTCGERKRCLF